MNLDDDAVAAWVPALGDRVRSQLPPERHLWRVNRFGARSLLGLSVVGLTWSEPDGSLVSVPFSEVEAVEMVGPNGVILHVLGRTPTRHTFPDVRDRETFQALLLADRQTASLVAGAFGTAPVAPAPSAHERRGPAARVASRLAPVPAPATYVPAPAAYVPAPAAYVPAPTVAHAPAVVEPVALAPVATAAVALVPAAVALAPAVRVGPSEPGRRTSRLAGPFAPYPSSPVQPAAPQVQPPVQQPVQPPVQQVRTVHQPAPRSPGLHPGQHHDRHAAATPAGGVVTARTAFERVRDLTYSAVFLGIVGVLVLVVSSQSAQQSVRSTGTLVLTYVGFGLIAAGVLALLVSLGRFLLLAGSPDRR